MEDFWNISVKHKNAVRYRQSRSYSPYSEFFSDWREEKNGLTYLEFNAFYRFDDIMEPLFGDTELTIPQRDWLFDVYVHYLIRLEFRGGLTRKEREIHSMMERLRDGAYRREISEIYERLSDKEQYYVAYLLSKQEKTGASVTKYAEALSVLLENGIVYTNRFQEKVLLLYVGKRENDLDKKKIQLVTELFQPLGYDLTVFWEKHFAVLDEHQTMEIDQIELI